MKAGKNIQVTAPQTIGIDLNGFFGQATIQKAGELYEQLERPLLLANQMQLPLRNLIHWVDVLKANPNKVWGKRYTFTEYVLFKIVEQLRTVNVGFELIQKFKQCLFEPIKIKGLVSTLQQAKEYIEDLKLPKDQKETLLQFLNPNEIKASDEQGHFTMLHMIIVDSIINRLPLSLAIFSDGSYMILNKGKEQFYSEEQRNKLIIDTYVTISVSSILKNFMRSDLSGFVIPKIGLLSYAENKLYEVIHSGDYESILISFKDKKIKPLELKKSENIKDRILDILDKGEFGEILVKKHKGIVTKIENTIKVTL